jgi:hypothetical protein
MQGVRVPWVGALIGLILGSSCAGDVDLNSSAPAASSGIGDNGTRLSVAVEPYLRLADTAGQAQYAFSFEVTSSASSTAVVVTAAVNGGAAAETGVIAPTDFNHGSPDKSAYYGGVLAMPYGVDSVQFCFTQAGSIGRLPKTVCTTLSVDACASGFGNCDGVAANGCETDLTTSKSNCGSCGNACATGSSCVSGACVPDVVVLKCEPGWADCDGDASNGCEVNLMTSDENCGSCGNPCDSLSHCSNGTCVGNPES